MKKNILITGNKGYIASNLLNHLDKSKYNIFGIDRVTGDRAEIFNSTSYYDVIVHTAALSGIKACEDFFEDAVLDNISSAFNIFNRSIYDETSVIFLSSQASKDPKSSVYAMMKRSIEVQAEMLNTQYSKSNIKVLRLTNVYGGVDYLTKKNTVVKKFINAYRYDEPIIVDGHDGSQTRDFIHVDDVCEYIRMCIEMGSHEKIYQPVDIGTGIQTSIKELAEMFGDYDIRYDEDSRSVGVETNHAEIDVAVNIFGYKAENTLQKYINEMKGIDNV